MHESLKGISENEISFLTVIYKAANVGDLCEQGWKINERKTKAAKNSLCSRTSDMAIGLSNSCT